MVVVVIVGIICRGWLMRGRWVGGGEEVREVAAVEGEGGCEAKNGRLGAFDGW